MGIEVGVLIISFVVLLVVGVPIAFSLLVSAGLTLVVSMPGDIAMATLAQRMTTGLDSFALLAIPFFILAGELMNRGGIASRLIDFAQSSSRIFTWWPGLCKYCGLHAFRCCFRFRSSSGISNRLFHDQAHGRGRLRQSL